MRSVYTEAVIPLSCKPSSEAWIDGLAFLGRPRLPEPSWECLEALREEAILVTGAAGSIGAAISLRLASLSPRKLILLDASEQGLYRLQSALKNVDVPRKPQIVLGSVTDSSMLDEVFSTGQPSLIFHAAAYKHVALLEEHPLAAIANNALGTHTLLACAERHGFARTILLSTDKAADPASILGASKRIAELLTMARRGTVVRLANVFGSEGSVVEVFLQQLHRDQPITISDAEATRYFLTREEAVDLLLSAAFVGAPGALFVPGLDRASSILSLAEFLIAAVAKGRHQPCLFTGLQPGEKMHETLWARDEEPVDSGFAGLMRIRSRFELSSLPLLIYSLAEAVHARDLARALRVVHSLVPAYTASSTVLALAHQAQPVVLQP